MNNWECQETNSDSLEDFIDSSNYDDEDGDGIFTSDYDNYGFYSYIYSNKFYYLYDSDNDQNATSVSVVDIAQYPEGISPFGLYDMIGNAPEIVKYDNNLWLA